MVCLISVILLYYDNPDTELCVACCVLSTVYNGHTTSADALWAGVPMLTLPGEKQISRTAAGFATAIGIPDMIVDSVKQFEDDAVRLAASFRRPPKPPAAPQAKDHDQAKSLARRWRLSWWFKGWDHLRARLVASREHMPLWDTPRFVKDLEIMLLAFQKRFEMFGDEYKVSNIIAETSTAAPVKRKKKNAKAKNK